MIKLSLEHCSTRRNRKWSFNSTKFIKAKILLDLQLRRLQRLRLLLVPGQSKVGLLSCTAKQINIRSESMSFTASSKRKRAGSRSITWRWTMRRSWFRFIARAPILCPGSSTTYQSVIFVLRSLSSKSSSTMLVGSIQRRSFRSKRTYHLIGLDCSTLIRSSSSRSASNFCSTRKAMRTRWSSTI